MSERLPTILRALAVSPSRIEANLARVAEAGLVPEVPNLWQLELGILRMWHRVIFRPNSIGTSSTDPVRPNWRARLLLSRPLRFPFLVAERAIAPLDFSGLASSRERIIRHLLGAHHDRLQFVYDLELLSAHQGALEELLGRAREVTDHDTPRSRWLRDLVVYEGYHERLVAAVEGAIRDGVEIEGDEAADPDISFGAYLRWCAAQPATPEATWRAYRRGEYSIADGWVRRPDARSTPERAAAPLAA